MTLHIYQPQSLAEHHEARTLAGAGLMIDIGDIGYVGVDLCKTPESRAQLLAMRKPGKAFVRESALFIHTGWHTPQLQEQVDAVPASSMPGTDLTEVGGKFVTTLERTAIDLMANREDSVELLCLLVRAGTSVAAIEQRAYQLSTHGITRVREILTQLPRELGQPLSPSP
ncbi:MULTISPECIES: hypothetical protein [Trueperella]|uniref:hypothetical protein n=1 Tax=Trueperella TaxID=1069494 RepID=UPI0008A280E1|nr:MULTISPECIES: hypothetical protein [Trueperella]MCM3906555.1 hypothetical protein [Trueperella bernardiae]OFS76003.1 hypothetical protein HMPREF3167_01635 [Trueperella sp. HMSC08B05]